MSFVMLAGGLTASALFSKSTAPVAASVEMAPLYEAGVCADETAAVAAATVATRAELISRLRNISKGKRAGESWQHAASERRSCPGGGGLLERELAQLQVGVLLDEIAKRPVVGEERDRLVQLVHPEAHPRGDDQAGGVRKRRMGL